VAPLPAVMTLRDARVHVGGSNHGNIPAKVERIIYQQFCFGTILRVPNIKLDNSHVGFGRGFDDFGLRCEIHRFK